MEIRLDLSRHCIETAARLKVERLIQSYFKAPHPDTEDRIAALTRFLKKVDFKDLRTRISQLDDPVDRRGDTRATLIITNAPKPVEIRFKDQSIYPTPTMW